MLVRLSQHVWPWKFICSIRYRYINMKFVFFIYVLEIFNTHISSFFLNKTSVVNSEQKNTNSKSCFRRTF